MTTDMLMLELQERGMDIKDKLIEHHTKYLEIDGVDETVWVTPKEHQQIHRSMRGVGIKIPHQICVNASNRTSYARRVIKRLKEHRDQKRNYSKKYCFDFTELMLPYIELYERVYYYSSTGNVGVSSSIRLK